MDDTMIARWLCLCDAVDTISDKAEKYNISLEDALKPIPIKKYIDEKYASMYQGLISEKCN